MKKIKFCLIALTMTAVLQSCSKKEDENCATGLSATYNGTTDCQARGSATRLITITETGVDNKIKISNLMLSTWGTTPLEATVNCDSKTITISKQEIGESGDKQFVSGTGSYTSNSVTIDLTWEIENVSTSSCSGTYIK